MRGVEKSALQGDLSQPREWREVGEVQQLYLYPVKSLSCVPVNSFTTGPWAAESGDMVDRQLIVLDKKGKMATARKWPNMTLVEPSLERGALTLKYPGSEDITVQLPAEGSKIGEGEGVKLDVFGEPCEGVDLGPGVGAWLSEAVLGDPEGGMRLVFHPRGDTSRPDKGLEPTICPTRRPQDKPYYADSGAYMMMTQPSVTELNRLLEEECVDLQVEERRFRPNIFINGEFPAFAEDRWAWVKIGAAVFRHAQVCDRCEFTMVDPEMGDKHPGGEPLKTLRKYRSALDPEERKAYGSSPFFGVMLGVEAKGQINVGDKVFIGK